MTLVYAGVSAIIVLSIIAVILFVRIVRVVVNAANDGGPFNA